MYPQVDHVMFYTACIIIQIAMMMQDTDCFQFCSDATLIYKNESFSARSHF